ncbi:MAG: indolepyruvate ferredoxin oxidoreductase family protein, partial [Gallionella sp.]|nr:indolepyruvate ferredoxin oxidoreductase family protein [Gallionella sp.]
LAFQIGRLAAAGSPALSRFLGNGAAADDSLSALIEARIAHLTAYQNAAHAQPYRRLVERVMQAEQTMTGGDRTLPMSRSVAKNYAKLLAPKDEYEVARLYTDGAFKKSLEEAFEGDYRLQFHLAPPLLGGLDAGGAPRKRSYGQWLLPLLKLLARGRGLRGSWFDLFGYSRERRLERQLAAGYARTIDRILPLLDAQRLPALLELASLPEQIRGYGHVKLASIQSAMKREQELLAALGLGA